MTDVLLGDAGRATVRQYLTAVRGVLRGSSDSGVRPIFNLADLGGRPDDAGAAHTTAALERLVTSELGPGEGCELWIPPGNWAFDPVENGSRMLTYCGFGRGVSVLVNAGVTTDPLLTLGDGLTHNVGGAIRDLSIDCRRRTFGSGHTGPAIKVMGLWDVCIERVKIFDTGGDGILVTGTAADTQLWGSANITDCQITSTRGSNIFFDQYVLQSNVRDCRLAGAGRDNAGAVDRTNVAAIRAFAFSELCISGGCADSSAGYGLWLQVCSQMNVHGLRILGPDRHAVYLGGGTSSGFGHNVSVVVEQAGYDGSGDWAAIQVEDYGCSVRGTVRATTEKRVAYWVRESTGAGAASTPGGNRYDITPVIGGDGVTPATADSLLETGGGSVYNGGAAA